MTMFPGPAGLWLMYKKHLLDWTKPAIFAFLKNPVNLHGNSE